MKTKIYSKLGFETNIHNFKTYFYLKRFYLSNGIVYIYQVCAGAHRGQSEKDMKFSGSRIIGSCDNLLTTLY